MPSSLRPPQTKLNSGQVRLRNSAEVLVMRLYLCTRVCVRAMIDLLKSHCRFANQVEGKFETHFG